MAHNNWYRLDLALTWCVSPFIVFGWQNSATYSSVIVYNVYWIVVIAWFLSQLYLEKRQRRLDASSASAQDADVEVQPSKYDTVVHDTGLEVK